MNLSDLHLKLVTGSYSAVKRSGLLDSRWGRRFYIRSYFFYKRFLEDSLAGLIRRYPSLIHGGDVFDIGANIGYTACVFAKAVDQGFRVYAFEPEDNNVAMLHQSLALFSLRERITVEHAAVGATEGTVELVRNEVHPADHRILTAESLKSVTTANTVSVPLVSIDGYRRKNGMTGPVSLIKIDVQGYEPAVCEGMSQTLESNPDCAVVLEYMPEALLHLGFDPPSLLKWFEDRGYSASTVLQHGHLSDGPPRNLAANDYVDVVFSRRCPGSAVQQ